MGKININMDSLKSSRDWVRHKVNTGSNVFRILPPFGDPEVHNNWPFRKWSVAWLQDPRTGKRRPFATPRTDGEACPVQEYVDALDKHLEARKAELKADGYSDGDIKAELEGLRSVQWNLRLQHVYAYNACDQAGTVGLLELKSTAHKAMKKMMSEYIKTYSQDPTSLNSEDDDSGVWFNITKDGKGKDTEYGVAFNQTREKDANGRLVRIDDRSALPEHVVTNYEELAYDLNSIYQRKTYEELRETLLYNLALIAQEVPEAILPGFEIDDIDVKAGASVLKKADDEGEAAEEETPPARTTKPAAKVNLNLSEEGDEDDAPKAKPAARPAQAAPAARPAATKPAPAPAKAAAPTAKAVVARAPAPAMDDDEIAALTAEIIGD